jgi:hypothetical protein
MCLREKEASGAIIIKQLKICKRSGYKSGVYEKEEEEFWEGNVIIATLSRPTE